MSHVTEQQSTQGLARLNACYLCLAACWESTISRACSPLFNTLLEFPDLESKNLREEEKAVIATLRGRSRQKEIGLADACSVARALDRPFAVAFELVVQAAQVLGVRCDWGRGGQERVLGMSEEDWKVVEGAVMFSGEKQLVPKDARSLAASLGLNSYSYRGLEDGAKIHAQLSEIYELFRWGGLPLSVADVKSAVALTYRQANLLKDAPRSGRYSIPVAIAAAIELDVDIQEIDADLKALSLFGVRGPEPQDEYLGVAWQSALASCMSGG